MTKLESVREDFQKALRRFEQILKENKTEIVRDSAIKRFELVFDLAWKAIKGYLEEYHNTYCASPQNCLKEAFRLKLIDYDEYWIEIAKLRNRSVHTYNEILADDIYQALPKTLSYFKRLGSILSSPS